MTTGRTRLAWSELPDGVRALVTDRVGEVTGVVSHEGGYSPGMAATLTTADGGRVFVKAVSAAVHEVSDRLYRREAEVNAMLPIEVPAPRLRWALTGDWVLMAFDAADAGVSTPWDATELDEAIAALTAIGRCPAPSDLQRLAPHLAEMVGWPTAVSGEADLASWDPWVAEHVGDLARLAASWAEAADGDAWCHNDARADNMVRAGGRVLLVDWPHAGAGAPWFDVVGMLPSVGLEGGGDPETWWRASGLAGTADADAVTCVVAGLAGYFVCSSVLPAPAGVPHVRAYQRAQGEVALAWLRDRLGV